jgi:cytochrome P450
MEMISVGFALASALVLWFIAPIIVATTRLKSKHLPPGPRSLPIIGSLHRVMGTFPHRRLMDLSRRHGPLMFLMLGEVPAVVVSSAEGAEAVMRTNDLAFATRPRSTTLDIVSRGRKGVIFTPYGDHWRQMRKICVVELFSARQVSRMESVWAHEVARLVRSFAGSGGGVVNFSETMYAFMNDLIGRAVFGGTCTQAQQAEYLREFSRAIELAGGFLLVDLFPSSRLLRRFTTGVRQLTWSFGRIQHIIGEIITARRALRSHDRAAAGDQDLLDVLLNLQEEGSLPIPLTAEIIGVVISVSSHFFF